MKPFRRSSDVVPRTPSVVMCDPRFPHNVGSAVRACSCFGVDQVWVTGRRLAEQVWAAKRVPREERMKGFKDVSMILDDHPLKHLPANSTPVAVELLRGAENLLGFEHPPNPIYVFGPEDGSISKSIHQHCHHRVFIPTRHCVNLSSAVYLVLWDRMFKEFTRGHVPMLPIDQAIGEQRGWPWDDLPEFV